MKHIFIDLGANDGDTIRQFRNWKNLHYDSDIKWEMYAFDPDPRMAELWKMRPEKDTVFENKAAWISDGVVGFTVAEDSISSTLMPEKEVKGKRIEVETFDFARWVTQFRGEHVVLKIDCEGAELPILTWMIHSKTDDIPIITMVEWHDGKMPKYDSNKDWILDNYRGKLVEWR